MQDTPTQHITRAVNKRVERFLRDAWADAEHGLTFLRDVNLTLAASWMVYAHHSLSRPNPSTTRVYNASECSA